MDNRARTVAVLPAYNEEHRIGKTLSRFTPGLVDRVIVVDDGSTDTTGKLAEDSGAFVIRHDIKSGVGAGIKDGVRHAIDNGFDIVVIMAGNGKDDPAEIPKLLAPIIEGKADYVQGSRFLEGGSHKNNPLFRIIAIKSFSVIWSVMTRTKITDITNGFRAYRTSLFQDPAINIWQDWLGTYELEYYLHYKVIERKFRVCEVSVSKDYPSKKNYTKIKPFLDWWKIVKPLIYLTLGIKK